MNATSTRAVFCLMYLLLFAAMGVLSESLVESLGGGFGLRGQELEQSELIVILMPSLILWLLTGKVRENLNHCIIPMLAGIASEFPPLSQNLPFTAIGTNLDFYVHTHIFHQNLTHMIAPLDANEIVVYSIGAFYMLSVIILGKWKMASK